MLRIAATANLKLAKLVGIREKSRHVHPWVENTLNMCWVIQQLSGNILAIGGWRPVCLRRIRMQGDEPELGHAC
jgi:hypothetical protein